MRWPRAQLRGTKRTNSAKRKHGDKNGCKQVTKIPPVSDFGNPSIGLNWEAIMRMAWESSLTKRANILWASMPWMVTGLGSMLVEIGYVCWLAFLYKPEGASRGNRCCNSLLRGVCHRMQQYFQVGTWETTKIDALYWAMRLHIYCNSLVSRSDVSRTLLTCIPCSTAKLHCPCFQAALAVMNPLSLTFNERFMTNHFACSGLFKPVEIPETNDSSFSPK